MVLSDDELRDRVCGLAAERARLDGEYASAVAELDRRRLWAAEGCRSVGEWLSFACGAAPGRGREVASVAAALEALPETRAALAAGVLSWDKAAAVSRVATAQTDRAMVEMARTLTGGQVVAVCARLREADAERSRRDAGRAHQARYARWWLEDHGVRFDAFLPAADGAALIRALERASKRMPADAGPWSARRADALAQLARGALSGAAAAGGDGGNGGPAVPEVVVTIDVATLATGAPGRCEIDDGPRLTVDDARRLACDARLVPVHVDADGTPLDVGRATRTVPPALRTALRVRDGGCVFPGCGATSAYWTDAHHIRHWADGGPTALPNLVLLCRGHHRLLHADPDDPHGRPWTIDPASRQFVRPDGVVHEPPEPGERTHRPDRHRSHPDPTSLQGDGERLTPWAIDLYLNGLTPPDPEPD